MIPRDLIELAIIGLNDQEVNSTDVNLCGANYIDIFRKNKTKNLQNPEEFSGNNSILCH